jgi:uncharacterized protein YbjT (DUF2867 family)
MGITGKVGGSTARHLLAQGKQVRALVRSRDKAALWADQGVELLEGDWNDGEAIADALRGVEAAFVMLPAVYAPSRDFIESKDIIAAYTWAFEKAEPNRVTALSSLGAEKSSGLGAITPLSLMENAFRELPFDVAFIRAGGFFENFLYGLHAAQGGILPVFYDPTSRKLAMVSTDDIGIEAARLLTEPTWSGKRTIELGTMVSPDEIAMQLGAVLQREVVAKAIARTEWTAVLETMGFAHGQTWAFEEMTESLNSGWISLGSPGTELVNCKMSAREVFASAQRTT